MPPQTTSSNSKSPPQTQRLSPQDVCQAAATHQEETARRCEERTEPSPNLRGGHVGADGRTGQNPERAEVRCSMRSVSSTYESAPCGFQNKSTREMTGLLPGQRSLAVQRVRSVQTHKHGVVLLSGTLPLGSSHRHKHYERRKHKLKYNEQF